MKPTIFLTLFAMTIAIPACGIQDSDQIAEVRSTVTVHKPDHAFLEQLDPFWNRAAAVCEC